MTPRKIPWRQVVYHWEIYLLVLPTLILIGLFQYYPAASGIYHSFFRWNGADVSEWVGLKNYTDLLNSREFWSSFNVAFTLGIWNVIKMVPAVAVAVWTSPVFLPAHVYRANGRSESGHGTRLADIFL